MSNSIFIQNQQTTSNKGTGLPFYTKKEYQYRFQAKSSVMVQGYPDVPNNKIPTFQIWNDNTLDTLQIFKVSGKNDISSGVADFSVLRETCLDSGAKIYSYRDQDTLDFNLDCGLYYLRIYNSADPNLGDFYSECFTVGNYINADVSVFIDDRNPSIEVQLRSNLGITAFSYSLDPPAGTGVTLPIPAPYTISIPFTLAIGDSSDLTFFVVTAIGEIFTDKYILTRPISDYVLLKQYT